MKHTPGPWEVLKESEYGDGSVAVIKRNCSKSEYLAGKTWPEYGVIATIDIPYEHCGPDANLIAAAPEMLEQLKMLHSVLEMALNYGLFTDESTDEIDSKDEVRMLLNDAEDAIAKAEGR